MLSHKIGKKQNNQNKSLPDTMFRPAITARTRIPVITTIAAIWLLIIQPQSNGLQSALSVIPSLNAAHGGILLSFFTGKLINSP